MKNIKKPLQHNQELHAHICKPYSAPFKTGQICKKVLQHNQDRRAGENRISKSYPQAETPTASSESGKVIHRSNNRFLLISVSLRLSLCCNAFLHILKNAIFRGRVRYIYI